MGHCIISEWLVRMHIQVCFQNGHLLPQLHHLHFVPNGTGVGELEALRKIEAKAFQGMDTCSPSFTTCQGAGEWVCGRVGRDASHVA